ncbi:MAG: hypothetical protein HQK54_17470 [Oligoflexales bacterium]|nr:hypothetical protein [Oligoflexales bacterium]
MSKTILYINISGYKSLPSGDTLRIISDKAELISVTDMASSLAALNNISKLAIMVSNAPVFEIFKLARKKHPKASSILLTSLPMNEYSDALSGEEDKLLDHIITNRTSISWTIHELRITIHKILTGDIFGIEKYLSPESQIFKAKITGSSDREIYNERLMLFAESCRLGQHTSKMVYGITEELLMNAILDAPIAAGKTHYSKIPTNQAIELNPEDYGEISYGCDGETFIISIADPFGALKKERFLTYLKKVLRRKTAIDLIDTKKEGAGLGFFKVLYSSHCLVCNVESSKKTEIISIINVKEQLRDFSTMPRSIHFFSV